MEVTVAEATTQARSGATRDAKLDPFRDLVGKVPDREVAKRAGVNRAHVAAYGIPSARTAATASAAPAGAAVAVQQLPDAPPASSPRSPLIVAVAVGLLALAVAVVAGVVAS